MTSGLFSGTPIERSHPAARIHTVTCCSSDAAPDAASSATASRLACLLAAPKASWSSNGHSTLRLRTAPTSALAIPCADSTPARAGTSTAAIPSRSASLQANCPPAPPNAHKAASRRSCPRCTDTSRIAPAMHSTATSRKPSAVSMAVVWPAARPSIAAADAAMSIGRSPSSPKIAGIASIGSLPSST